MLQGSPYVGYTYAYPHKTAYGPLAPPVPLREAWAEERRGSLFLYLHVPFCEMRCGFCNLFTTLDPGHDLEAAYLQALRREAEQVAAALQPFRVARMALGGGTPTFLSAAGLEQLLSLARGLFGADPDHIPSSVETSPATATADKLRLLRDRGVERISIGVQSFLEPEVAAAGRSQRRNEVEAALERIREERFPVLNLDLIYGLPGQTPESYLRSLEAALLFAPEELYLYPLYVRPLTGLHRVGAESWDSLRLACYRAGREALLDRGYEQVSMRFFRRPRPCPSPEPDYCCQEDGMVGLGCGARSYTRALHYSTEYAVGRTGVRSILESYLRREAESFAAADCGFRLDDDEQRRRYVLKSLLRVEGLSREAYRDRFGSEANQDLPGLARLVEAGLVTRSETHLKPTEAGLERSDAVGPWLYSERVRRSMEAYPLR